MDFKKNLEMLEGVKTI